MKCDFFCNVHCIYDCPNLAIDEFEERYEIPASDVGCERIRCIDCQYTANRCTCDDCYFVGCSDCPQIGGAI